MLLALDSPLPAAPDSKSNNAGIQRTGLTMVLVTLFVIGFITALWFGEEQNIKEQFTRDKGLQLSKLLSALPYDDVLAGVQKDRLSHPLQVVLSDDRLAYLQLQDPNGATLYSFTPKNIQPSAQPLSRLPAEWFGERFVDSGADGSVWEYHAPLLQDGQFAGHIRFAYVNPGWLPEMQQLPLTALAALAIFALAALFYFVLQKAMAPLRTISSQLTALQQSEPATAIEQHNWSQFNQQFQSFVEGLQGRVTQLEASQTDLQTSTKTIEYQRARVVAVLETLPMGLLVIDQSGTVNIANKRLRQLLGDSATDVIGRKPREWLDDDKVVAYLTRADRSNNNANAVPIEFSPVAYPDRLIEVTAWPVRAIDANNTLHDKLVIFRDITAEKLLRESSSEFIAHVAHELKSPLNVLNLYTEMLQGPDGEDPAMRIEATNVISDEVERLSLLISNILSISKIETGSVNIERTRVRIHDLVQDTFDSCSRAASERQLIMELDMPREVAPVAVDKELMRVAINNLLTNAIKYSNDGGRVDVSIEETDRTVSICVKDEGIGIAEADQQKVFEKFVRSEDDAVSQRAGHGLGLSLAREIVQLHQGTLTLHSEYGVGSEFRIELNKHTERLQHAV